MLQIKVHGQTPKSGKSICHSCKRSSTVKGQNCEELVFCAAVFGETKYGGIVPFKISECAQYHPSNMPWLHEMEQMAWIVEARRRGPAGFTVPVGEDAMEFVIRKPGDDNDSKPPR